ncbi:MAG TPA: ABC transporter ATP-binding protein [Bacteroidales bacterium]|jgi:ABC-type sugar transport system ATPase subunit|nr:ABC transporter ATP-binding protein [Bacteroidales bacterium]HQG63936.1 ABC transporter ATP-binding protein [Bacteroidales bacterium]HQK69026.1 ABC transporter ATP-binding protein [Bacteroidales bacterium]
MLKMIDVNKKLGNFALSGINLEIPEGEYFVLLGRSGSGKTQLLELIAGLYAPDSGEIRIAGKDVTRTRIQDRNIGLMFQDFAVFPNMTVSGNISFPLRCRKYSHADISRMVAEAAEKLNIDHLLDRLTNNLSSGELQRVALARTLITSPRLLLLDEPMASVDASLKDDIRRIFRQLNREGLTILHVTHDYREAISLAARVGVLHNGRIIQEGKPGEVFRRPENEFIARYAGIRNFFRVKLYAEDGSWNAVTGNKMVISIPPDEYPVEGLLAIRSEEVKILNILSAGNSQKNMFRAVVREIYPSETGMEIILDAGEMIHADITMNEFTELNIKELSEVWITFSSEAPIVFSGKELI